MGIILIVPWAASRRTIAEGGQYDSGCSSGGFVDFQKRLDAAGWAIEPAAPGGTAPTADLHVLGSDGAGVEAPRRAECPRAPRGRLEAPPIPTDADVGRNGAAVIPGGHGPVEELDMGRILVEADRSRKVIGSVCRGYAAPLSAKHERGALLFPGRGITAVADEEERDLGIAGNAPRLLTDALRRPGARFGQGAKRRNYVVRDGDPIGGQGPQASGTVADAAAGKLAWRCDHLSSRSSLAAAAPTRLPDGTET